MAKKFKSGFSLLELVIALFISTIVAVSTVTVFSSSYTGFTKSRAIQKDIENAQFAMNLMAKSFRTGQIISDSDDEVKFYNFSNGGECIEYKFEDNKLKVAYTQDAADGGYTWCQALSYASGDFDDMTDTESFVNGSFDAVPNSIGVAGKVTILINVCSRDDCSGNPIDKASMQTTVSLRNYEEI